MVYQEVTMKRTVYLFLFISIAFSYSAQGQFIEDALRFSHSGTLVSTRSAGMGNAFVGLANDASALYWNPAGLGQLRVKEFSIGLSHVGMDNDATMLGITTPGSNGSTSLSHINMALPFPVVRGSLVIAAGYNRLLDYNGAAEIDIYNPQSSIQASLFDDDIDLDFAWQLGLEDTLAQGYIDAGQPGWLAIPVANRVQQIIDQQEEGGLNQWSFGGSMEIARGAMVGVGLNVLSGSYRYERTFIEEDINGVWQDAIVGIPLNGMDYVTRTDFQRLTLQEEYTQDVSGWNMKFGFLYNFKDKARIGVAIQTASLVTINEDYFKTGDSEFADASMGYDLAFENHNYDIITPAIYSFGASYSPSEFATVSADIELVDYSNIELDASNDWDDITINDFNRDIRRLFRSTNNFRIGAEFNVPETGLFLRGGFGYRFSPYEDDENKSEYDVKTFSAGIGYRFRDNFAVQGAYVMSNYESFAYTYFDPDSAAPEESFRYTQETSVSQLMFGLSYYF
ncbi:MAG: hypothetical protein C0600_05075 [Ignavibacteria bacterium]|nr:MAG: hypothetical protein C0600_05075 [Ignavibacteria bacterium]